MHDLKIEDQAQNIETIGCKMFFLRPKLNKMA